MVIKNHINYIPKKGEYFKCERGKNEWVGLVTEITSKFSVDGPILCTKGNIGEFYSINSTLLDSSFTHPTPEEIKLLDDKLSSLSKSGILCSCGNGTFLHRHGVWIECTACGALRQLKEE